MATLEVVGEGLPATQPRHEALSKELDEYLERYLHLLDKYQSIRDNLSKALSLGFMGIAQANFRATNRMRYGQDYYDQRMQASRIIDVDTLDDGVACFSAVTAPSSATPSDTSDEMQEKQDLEQKPDNSNKSTTPDAAKAADATSTDPLRWFGILVPQALRTAQGHFVDIVNNSVSQLASVDAQMKALEIEIRRTRKHIQKSPP